MRLTSSASSDASVGRIVTRRRASIVLPAPGGPVRSRWCRPAAATSSARRAHASPRTSARSSGSSGSKSSDRPSSSSPDVGGGQGHGASPFRHSRRVARSCTGRTHTPSTSAASAAFAAGTTTVVAPALATASTRAKTPGTPRTLPSRPSSPSTAIPSSARRKRLRRDQQPDRDCELETGSGLAQVPRCEVHRDPLLMPREFGRQERRGRSRDSRTAASGSPTTWYDGNPCETWTSTMTGRPSTPRRVALVTEPSTIDLCSRKPDHRIGWQAGHQAMGLWPGRRQVDSRPRRWKANVPNGCDDNRGAPRRREYRFGICPGQSRGLLPRWVR